jgi:hypothetical protein
MYLTIQQRAALRAAAKLGIVAIDAMVLSLRTHNPEAFHDDESLRERVFLVELPIDIPHRRFIRRAPALSPRQPDCYR